MFDNHVMLYVCLWHAQRHMQAGEERAASDVISDIADIFGETYTVARERYRFFIGFF